MSRRVRLGGVFAATALLVLVVSGCRSHMVDVAITNRCDVPLHNVEVTYPGGSYGLSSLKPGGEHRSTVKILGQGMLQVEFTDPAGKIHRNSGPNINRGDGGTVKIEVVGAGDFRVGNQIKR